MRSRAWLFVAAFALLFAGITNAHAHLHVCFDGQEPPASVHFGEESAHEHSGAHGLIDSGLAHHASGDGAPHDDTDVDLGNQALAKTVKHDDVAAAVLAVLFWDHEIGPAAANLAPAEANAPLRPVRSYSLPLSRAPPR
jgi:hypothetical protein